MSRAEVQPGKWAEGTPPANVRLGENTLITSELAFKRFKSQREPALVIGRGCTLDGVHFALGKDAAVTIGDFCYFANAVLLCEAGLTIGSYVMIGWNATIADTDFHPVAPADRIADALACSPLGRGLKRPPIERRPVVIEDAAWIGPSATILKGVRIGMGALVEPGSVVTRDVPPLARVMGNPAAVIGKVDAQ
jgi:acetyltransferase-like isoleucine patch superfamily enzyme